MQAVKKSVSAGYRLDPKVIITMSVIALVSIGVFGFRYMSHKPCKPVEISIDATNFHTGTPIRFSCTADKKDNCEWSIGDQSGKKLDGQTVVYTYTEPGQYMIELSVNGRCKEYKYVTIEKAPKILDPDLVPRIICAITEVEIGKEVVFKDSTPKATSWEWRFGETGGVDDIKREATYKFMTPGLKVVTLTINDNPDLNATHKIFVKEKAGVTTTTGPVLPNIGDIVKPQPDAEPINQASRPPAITDKQFSDMLTEVVKGNKSVSDFTVYLCNVTNVPVDKYKVEYKNEKKISFEEMCADLKTLNPRKVKKISSRLKIDDATGCITSMSVKVDIKTF